MAKKDEKTAVNPEPGNSRLLEQVVDLRTRLEEAEQAIDAIRSGDVDALVVHSGDKPRVYTLEGPDLPYRSIVETMAAGALTLDEDLTISYCNAAFSTMTGISMEHLIGSSFLDLVPVDRREVFMSFLDQSRTERSLQELPLKTASGTELYAHLAGGCEFNGARGSCIVVTDISARKSAEEALQTAHDKLFETNSALLAEIDRRKQAETDLDIKSRTLEEMNTALRVLLKQREEDKSSLEEDILLNVKELILPYVEKLKKSRLDAEQASNANIIETNLREITSPIVRKLHSFDLTPKEIEVVSYLKDGKSTKEIAELLRISPRAIEFHRYRIRKKLGLEQKKTNLRSFLRSIP